MTRDPIGENGGLNLYSAVSNSPTGYFDLDGLVVVVAEDFGPPSPVVGMANCAGAALGDGWYIEPAKGQSWKDVAIEHGFSDFIDVRSAEECSRHCGPCRRAVLMFIPEYHPRKDAFNEAYDKIAPVGCGQRTGQGNWVYDVHFVFRPACNDTNYLVPNRSQWLQLRKATPITSAYPPESLYFSVEFPDKEVESRYKTCKARKICMCRVEPE